ncbi:NADPH-dependent FMN reductase [Obesumbacterium proteus]|uniref:NADPH-dependent FMN reductase n=1 Tax=Obesumbacterium proteus TaxID=82983 RepID=UPI0024304E3C|nr:NADPH-dependent FMN reductase [Obesumbacterium proteus]
MVIVSLAGSPKQPSRSSALLAVAHRWLARHNVEIVHFSLQDFVAEDLLFANFNSPQILALNHALSRADGLLVATPVYKAAYSGALKSILDLLPERALEHKVVLPLATAGSSNHFLALDYALKPVLSALKAQEVLHGVFATDVQIDYASREATLEAALAERLEESLSTFYAAIQRRGVSLATKEHAANHE